MGVVALGLPHQSLGTQVDFSLVATFCDDHQAVPRNTRNAQDAQAWVEPKAGAGRRVFKGLENLI